MIQRIQSLYILIASCLIGLAAILPLFSFQLDGSSETVSASLSAFSWKGLDAEGVWQNLESLYALGIAFCLTALFTFSIIFFYKNRKKQISMVRYSFILTVALLATVGYYVYLVQTPDVVATKPQVGTLLVAISLVFDWLAIKAIRKDEELVRSIDRIR